MSALNKLSTGVPGLDILTLGGIPEGRATLIILNLDYSLDSYELDRMMRLIKMRGRARDLADGASPALTGRKFALYPGVMKETSGRRTNGPRAWDFPEGADNLAMPTILLVEDDGDIRDMMTTLLGLAGFGVVSCETAECGLNALREQDFDLVLTDYALPRQSGLWLLENAEAEGLIDGIPVLIVTAHPHVAGAGPYEVVQKPFDLDDLVDRVRRRTEGDRGPRRRRPSSAPAPAAGNGNDGHGPHDCPEPVELILYVSSQSPRSFAAVRNIKKVLERFESSRVRLTIYDLSEDPSRGIEDAVAFTPTLVRRTPGPRTFILGHITNPELVLELLADCDPLDS